MRNRPVFWIVFLVLVFAGLAVFLLPSRSLSLKRTTDPSPALKAAISEARRRLPEFTRALSEAKPGDRFALRARFTTPLGNEYLWLRDPIPSSKGFLGLIDQDPAFLKKKKGELVLVPKADIVDWMTKTETGAAGEFTQNLE